MKQRKLFRMVYEAIFYPFDHPSADDVVFMLNLEEIATLWHLPGAVAATPTLPRIDSTKGVAPVNLPL
jgi:predicted component of type VI protein secretion system